MRSLDGVRFNTIFSKFNDVLQSREWKLCGRIPHVAQLWKKPGADKNKKEILIPIDENVEDWYEVFKSALDTLCMVEGWDSQEVGLYLLSNTKSNEIVSVRAYGSLCVNNTLPIAYGVDIHDGFRKILFAGVNGFFEKSQRSLSQVEKGSNLVKNYISGIRLAPSSVGSYIINMELPNIFSDFESESPSGISDEIERSLKKIIKVSESTKFSDVDVATINIKICDAVMRFGGKEEDQDVEVIFKKFSPFSEKFISLTKVDFKKEYFPKIRVLSVFCKSKEIPQARQVFGWVTRLDREIGDRSGVIFIDWKNGGGRVKLKIKLNEEEYRYAISAHEDSLPVSFICDVTKIGNRWFGDNVMKFSISKGEELDISI